MTPDFDAALLDDNLLGQFLESKKTWEAWLTVDRAFYGLKPARGDRKRFKELTGRSKWPRKPSRELWTICGTRAGKTQMTAFKGCYIAVFVEHQLSPGEVGYVIIIAPTKKQATITKTYLSAIFNQNPFFKQYVVRETSEEIELSNGITITVLSSDYRSLRGYTAVAVIIDEVAYLNLEGSRPDIEVVRAARSRLMTTGGPLIAISSPYSKRGVLFDSYKKHYGGDNTPDVVVPAPSLLMNPTLDKEAVEAAYLEDADAAKADLGGQFREDIESPLSIEIVEAAVVPGRIQIPFTPRIDEYFAFYDPSGGRSDAAALAIGHYDHENRKYIVDCLCQWPAPHSPQEVTAEAAKILREYDIDEVVGDKYAGEWPRAEFDAHDIFYIVADIVKSDLYAQMIAVLNSGKIELVDNKELINELVNLERRRGRSGRDIIDHPPRGSDDLANVIAGLCYLLSKDEEAYGSADIRVLEAGDRGCWFRIW